MVVYSWGAGADGRLGHGNNLNQFKPEEIKHFRDKDII